jgi:probable addiction module antidote protein
MECDMAVKLIPFDAADFLRDEETIAAYLNSSTETGNPDVMLSALSAVARARGMAELADKAGVNRESLYKALAPGAKPRYDTIFKVVRALGVNMAFHAPAVAKQAPTRKSAALKSPAKKSTTRVRRAKTHVEHRAAARADKAPGKRR